MGGPDCRAHRPSQRCRSGDLFALRSAPAARRRRGYRCGEARPRDAAPLRLNHRETPRKLPEADCVAYEHRARPAQTRFKRDHAQHHCGVRHSGFADGHGRCRAMPTSRTLVVDPNEHSRVGSMQYPETLPLNDHEVVLTFDDGPLPRYTNRVLETLASECVKATFFMVGQMARPLRGWCGAFTTRATPSPTTPKTTPFAKCL